jgi:hypothetical protein
MAGGSTQEGIATGMHPITDGDGLGMTTGIMVIGALIDRAALHHRHINSHFHDCFSYGL